MVRDGASAPPHHEVVHEAVASSSPLPSWERADRISAANSRRERGRLVSRCAPLLPALRATFSRQGEKGKSVPYCTFTLAALIIGHHLAISAFCQLPSASGVSWSFGGMSRPRSRNFCCTAGSAIASTAAALSLVTMSFGVPFG